MLLSCCLVVFRLPEVRRGRSGDGGRLVNIRRIRRIASEGWRGAACEGCGRLRELPLCAVVDQVEVVLDVVRGVDARGPALRKRDARC